MSKKKIIGRTAAEEAALASALIARNSAAGRRPPGVLLRWKDTCNDR